MFWVWTVTGAGFIAVELSYVADTPYCTCEVEIWSVLHEIVADDVEMFVALTALTSGGVGGGGVTPIGRWISTAVKFQRSTVGAVSAMVMSDSTGPPVPFRAWVHIVSADGVSTN